MSREGQDIGAVQVGLINALNSRNFFSSIATVLLLASPLRHFLSVILVALGFS